MRNIAKVIALSVALTLALVGCADTAPNNTATATATAAAATATATPVEAVATPATPEPTAEPVAAANNNKVGTKVRVSDEQFITVTKTSDYTDKYFKPAKGSKYLAVLVVIEGIALEGSSYNPMYFKVRDAEGYEYTFSIFSKTPALSAGNTLAAGAKVKGWVTFEVPKSAKGLVLVYSPVMGLAGDPVEISLGG